MRFRSIGGRLCCKPAAAYPNTKAARTFPFHRHPPTAAADPADTAAVYRELCEAAEEWVEILHKDGTPLPKPKRSREYSGKFMVRIDPAIHQRLALKAVTTGESLNQLAARTLAKA